MRRSFDFAFGFAEFLRFLNAFFVEGCTGANRTVGRNVNNDHGNGAAAFCLEREQPVVFQRAGEQCAERRAFGYDGRNRFGVTVLADDGVDNLVQPNQPPHERAVFNMKRYTIVEIFVNQWIFLCIISLSLILCNVF